MIVAMVTIGSWVTARISSDVVESTASATALLMDSIIAPLSQELEENDQLSIGPVRALEEILTASVLGERVLSIKIWKPGGLVAYATDPGLVGASFPLNESAQRALAGEIVSELDQVGDAESTRESAFGKPLLEIYSPIRRHWTGEIIAVVEFYEDATALSASLARARVQSWAIVSATTLLIGIALFGVVQRGSVMIARQRAELEGRIRESERLAAQNAALRTGVEHASGRVTELNEQFLHRLGADLHDGPAQLIGLALLRASSIAESKRIETRRREAAAMTTALRDAMTDIRNICAGLSLPEVESLSAEEAVKLMVSNHEQRTGTSVALSLDAAVAELSLPGRICVSRLVQEGLNNAVRHANGIGQRVWLIAREGVMEAGVASRIPSTDRPSVTHRGGLGLQGLKERVRSLGGSFAVTEADGEMMISMSMPLGSVGDARKGVRANAD
ncbi:sensor histidine kinase [Pararhizobium haloflavum]|uniref:sensor histidine kinase n=1 Tax=Pararhizobium haloflavum TaxID=2037914 RepID=UPI0018E4AAF7|nr:sensor histidine kinase [Pararhizobium haloflavum]